MEWCDAVIDSIIPWNLKGCGHDDVEYLQTDLNVELYNRQSLNDKLTSSK